MKDIVLCREISVEGVNGTALVRVRGKNDVSISFPNRKVFEEIPEPIFAMALTDAVVANGDGWDIQPGESAEICIAMNPTSTEEDMNRWLEEHRGWRDGNMGVFSPEPLPEEHLLFSLAYVDSAGIVMPSPRANSPHNWVDHMIVREAYSVE